MDTITDMGICKGHTKTGLSRFFFKWFVFNYIPPDKTPWFPQ